MISNIPRKIIRLKCFNFRMTVMWQSIVGTLCMKWLHSKVYLNKLCQGDILCDTKHFIKILQIPKYFMP